MHSLHCTLFKGSCTLVWVRRKVWAILNLYCQTAYSTCFSPLFSPELRKGKKKKKIVGAYVLPKNSWIEKKIVSIFYAAHCSIVWCKTFFLRKKMSWFSSIERILISYRSGSRNAGFLFLCLVQHVFLAKKKNRELIYLDGEDFNFPWKQ